MSKALSFSLLHNIETKLSKKNKSLLLWVWIGLKLLILRLHINTLLVFAPNSFI